MKSKSTRLLFGVLTLAIVTICPPVFAQYQYGGDQARIVFLSSNSTQVTATSSNSAPSFNGYSNSTQGTTTHSSSNPTQAVATLKSPNAVPEFGSIAPMILVISIICIVVFTAKTRFSNIRYSSET